MTGWVFYGLILLCVLASGLPQAGGALGQPGFDVRRRSPGGTITVSLLVTPDPGPQAVPGGRLLSD